MSLEESGMEVNRETIRKIQESGWLFFVKIKSCRSIGEWFGDPQAGGATVSVRIYDVWSRLRVQEYMQIIDRNTSCVSHPFDNIVYLHAFKHIHLQ